MLHVGVRVRRIFGSRLHAYQQSYVARGRFPIKALGDNPGNQRLPGALGGAHHLNARRRLGLLNPGQQFVAQARRRGHTFGGEQQPGGGLAKHARFFGAHAAGPQVLPEPLFLIRREGAGSVQAGRFADLVGGGLMCRHDSVASSERSFIIPVRMRDLTAATG
jgi:hypothetical protein